jgi:uncharacterized membrane protein YecN with MAPEG domain
MAPVTTLYAGLLGLLYLALAYLVVRGRQRHRINLGIGAEGQIERQVRVHANFAEYAPIFLILLLLAELAAASPWLLHGAGAGFVIARLGHAQGLASAAGVSRGRFWGTALTWLLILVLSIYLIFKSF